MTEAVPHDPETGEVLAAPLPSGPAEAPTPPPEAAAGPPEVPAPPEPAKPTPKPRAPRARPPGNADEMDTAVAEAQAQLAAAGATGVLGRDPYRLVLAGLSATVGIFPKVVRRIEASVSAVVVELGGLVRAVRHPLTDAERAAFERGVTETIDRAARDILPGVIGALPTAINRRSLALVIGGTSLAVAVVGIGAFFAGRASAAGEARAWTAAQRADLALATERLTNLPVAEARMWAVLIRANPAVREAVAKAQNRHADASGVPYGAVPLWLAEQRTPPAGR